MFGVSIEGIPVFAGLDLYDQVGFLKALVTKSEVVVADGQLNIEFTAVKDSPIINGIEILPAGS